LRRVANFSEERVQVSSGSGSCLSGFVRDLSVPGHVRFAPGPDKLEPLLFSEPA